MGLVTGLTAKNPQEDKGALRAPRSTERNVRCHVPSVSLSQLFITDADCYVDGQGLNWSGYLQCGKTANLHSFRNLILWAEFDILYRFFLYQHVSLIKKVS